MTRMNWEKWYAEHGPKLHDSLLVFTENIETQMDGLKHWSDSENEPYASIFALATFVRHCLAIDRALLSKQEASTAETRRTFEAINKFVEHYTPMLEQLEAERNLRNQTIGGNQSHRGGSNLGR